MATSSKRMDKKITIKKVTKMVPITTDEEVVEDVQVGVTLNLDKDEAETLADILAKVGGAEYTLGKMKATRRKYSAQILKALSQAGYDWSATRMEKDMVGGSCGQGIQFIEKE